MLILLFALCLTAVAAYRLCFGVDVTDESLYVAMPYELVLGNRPFVDEHLLPTTSILLAPVIAGRRVLTGRSDGLVLFVRRLYLGLALITSLVVFATLKRFVCTEAAMTAALLSVAFVPFSIPSISYNTAGSLFLTIGLMSGLASLRTRRVSAFTVGQALALALAVIAYPPMIVPAATAVIATIALHRGRSGGQDYWRIAIPALLVLALAVAAFCLRFVRIGDVVDSIEYLRSFGVHAVGFNKVIRIADQARNLNPYSGPFLEAIAALFLMGTLIGRRWARISIVALIGLFAATQLRQLTTSHLVIMYAAIFLLPLVFAALRGSVKFQELWWTCWLPSLIAGCVTALSSSNGLPNSAIGLLPAAIVALALAIESTNWTRLLPIAICATLALEATLHSSSWRYVYRDDPIPRLREHISTGPFAGLRTTPAKARFLSVLDEDVRNVARRAKTCVFYDDFPAGYLFSSMRPLAPSVWIPAQKGYSQFDRTRLARFFTDHRPDAAFEFKTIPMSSTEVETIDTDASDPMRHFFWRGGYRIDAERPEYTAYLRCDACVTNVFDLENLAPLAPGENYGNTALNGWTWYATDAERGRAAITNRVGASMKGSIRDFQPGNYEVDLSFFSYGPERSNAVTVSLGNRFRDLTFGPGCPAGIHRFANVLFQDVRDARFEIRSSMIGQQSLIVDTLVLRRVPTLQPPSNSAGFLTIGPELQTPTVIEAEEMIGVQKGDYRQLVYKGWAAYEMASYSGGRAALTGLPGAELRQRLSDFSPGDYEATVRVFNYTTRTKNEIEISIGDAHQRLSFGGPKSSVGITEVRCILRNVSSSVIKIRAVSIGQQSLIIDSVTLRPKQANEPI